VKVSPEARGRFVCHQWEARGRFVCHQLLITGRGYQKNNTNQVLNNVNWYIMGAGA